jgi:hypothetical protein
MTTRPEKHERLRARARLETCLACGAPLQESLFRLGSLRCLDCRQTNTPLDESLFRRWQLRAAY